MERQKETIRRVLGFAYVGFGKPNRLISD